MYAIGATGTRKGLTHDQYVALGLLASGDHLRNYWTRTKVELHHGDCKGADRQVHMFFYDYCRGLDRGKAMRKLQYHIHPGIDRYGRSPYRAFCPIDAAYYGDVVYEPKLYLERNYDIVEVANVMLVFPGDFEEKLRSGTWATFRMARQRQLSEGWSGSIYVLWPDGTTERVVRDSVWTGKYNPDNANTNSGDIAG